MWRQFILVHPVSLCLLFAITWLFRRLKFLPNDMQKSQLYKKQMRFSSVLILKVTIIGDKFWKTVRLDSFQMPEQQYVLIHFSFLRKSRCLYLRFWLNVSLLFLFHSISGPFWMVEVDNFCDTTLLILQRSQLSFVT